MDLIDRSIRNCIDSFESNKVTERKRGMDDLKSLLNNVNAHRFLNKMSDNNTTRSRGWDMVFNATHQLVLKEMAKLQADEQKGVSTQATRDNHKASFTSLLQSVVKHGVPRLTCSDVVVCVINVLGDKYLRKSVGDTYINILHQSILPVRKYQSAISSEKYVDLLDVFWPLLKKPLAHTKKNTITNVLTSIVKHGIFQSPAVITMNSRLNVLAEAYHDVDLRKNVPFQTAIIQLTVAVCKKIAKDNRSLVCQFGEEVAMSVMSLYEERTEEKKDFIFDFLLLQVCCHHPCGLKEGEKGTYAHNWQTWNHQCRAIYKLVEREIRSISRKFEEAQRLKTFTKRDLIGKKFLQLAVEVCNQVFEDGMYALDSNETLGLELSLSTTVGPGGKRRRIMVGIQAIMETLRTATEPRYVWPWLSLLSALMNQYPNTVSEGDFVSFLELVADMQSSCKDTSIMDSLCRCCISLLKVESQVDTTVRKDKKVRTIWVKIWDTTLRTAGLNQSDVASHSLLQSLVRHSRAPDTSVLLGMYLTGTIRLTEQSLKTLELLCSLSELPGTPVAPVRFLETQQSQPTSCESTRTLLLARLLPDSQPHPLCAPCCLGKLLARLVSKAAVRVVDDSENVDPSVRDSELSELEDLYLAACYESGVVAEIPAASPGTSKKDVDSEVMVLDTETWNSLILLLQRDCDQLLGRLLSSEQEQNLFELAKELIHYCTLMLYLLSSIKEFGVAGLADSNIHRLQDLIQSHLSTVGKSVVQLLQNPKLPRNSDNLSNLLTELQMLYEESVNDDVAQFLVSVTPHHMLEVVFSKVRRGKGSEQNDDDADAEGFFPRADVFASSVSDMDTNDHPSPNQNVRMKAVRVLSAFSCKPGIELTEAQSDTLLELLEMCISKDFQLTRERDFEIVFDVTRRALQCKVLPVLCLDKVLLVLQAMCRARHQDEDGAYKILTLLHSLLRHMQNSGTNTQKENTIVLLAAFWRTICKKKYSPKVRAQFVQCVGETLKVDRSLMWAVWDQEPGIRTPIGEELPIFLKSPFFEVQMAAVRYVGWIFWRDTGITNIQEKLKWEKKMFEKMFDQEKLSETKMLESALHALIAVIVVSPHWRKRALFMLTRLIKEKNIPIDIASKVLGIVVEKLRVPTVAKLMEANLNYLLFHWLDHNYQLEEFPWLLFGCETQVQFYKKYLEVIVPILLHRDDNVTLTNVCDKLGNNLSEMVEICYPLIMARLLPCQACAEAYENYKISSKAIHVGKKLLKKMETTLGEEKINYLLSTTMDDVILNIFRLLFDLEEFKNICGYVDTLPEPDPPYFNRGAILKSLEYLQSTSSDPEVPLLRFLAAEVPGHIQKIVLKLAVDINKAPTIEHKLRTFHCYTLFVDILILQLSSGADKLKSMATFVIRDVLHYLTHLIKQNASGGDVVLAVSACNFLYSFCEKCFPACANILEHFLNMTVSMLVPLVRRDDSLGKSALKLLQFLIITQADSLSAAIKMLDPFPSDPVFEELRQVHQRLKYKEKEYNLEEEIMHFLKAGEKNLGCRSEGLIHLRRQLSERKTELRVLYEELSLKQGMPDAVLHRLMVELVQLAHPHQPPNVRQEAARCLGELGPANLAAISLQASNCLELSEVSTDDHLLLVMTQRVVTLLVTYLVDEDVAVIEAASKALYSVLHYVQGKLVVDTSSTHDVNKDYLVPFYQEAQLRPLIVCVEEDMFCSTVGDPSLWCPEEPNCTHDQWIVNIVVTILNTFVKESCFFQELIPVCKVKVPFCEEILPLLTKLTITSTDKSCGSVLYTCIGRFFEWHFNRNLQVTSSSQKRYFQRVCFDKKSVHCMLNVVHCARLHNQHDIKMSDINYLYVAQAAQFCSAYFTSIMYAEMWYTVQCRDKISLDTCSQNMLLLDYLCEKVPTEGDIMRNLLREAYTKIGDDDAVYGCGSSHLVDTHSRINHYQLLGKWDRVMLSRDMELSSGHLNSTRDMLLALQRSGLLHLLSSYVAHSSANKTELEDFQYESAWRLGQWDLPPVTKSSHFEAFHFNALKALSNADTAGVQLSVAKARESVIESLSQASLESIKNLYPLLSQLQSLQELETFAKAVKPDEAVSYAHVLDKWLDPNQRSKSNFEYLEPIFSQRAVLLKIACDDSTEEQCKKRLTQALSDLQLEIATVARKEAWLHVSERSLGSLSSYPNLPPETVAKLKLEEAQLLWEKGDHDIGQYVLRSLIAKLPDGEHMSQQNLLIQSTALKLYGDWMAETKSENASVVITRYYRKALEVLSDVEPGPETSRSQLEVYASLARFADAEYQQMVSYFNSSQFEDHQCLTKAVEEAEKLRTNFPSDAQRTYRLYHLSNKLDENMAQEMMKEKDMYLTEAMKYHLLCLRHGEKYNLKVFRVMSLWFENTTDEAVANILTEYLDKIPSYKFICVLPQLTPRISNKLDLFTSKVNRLLERCGKDHPHHTLPFILALANSYKDEEFIRESKMSTSFQPEPRVVEAKAMMDRLAKCPSLQQLVPNLRKVSEAYISLANMQTEKQKSTAPITIPPRQPIMNLKNIECVLVPTITLPISVTGNYSTVVGIQSFAKTFTLVGGINAPKQVKCVGTDGITRRQLVKGKDDLRQDAVMEQVFSIMNNLLRDSSETAKRKLAVRTYKIVPLSQRSGVVEWCENTQPLSLYLCGDNQPGNVGAHKRYRPKDMLPVECRMKMTKSASNNEQKLEVYKNICKLIKPVFHHFFLEKFPVPGVWFERRLAYIHSVATSSMVGYILGLGDRHLQNILIDNSTAEVIHIDFGIAFEQGRILPTPETVPFRLTRDIEDGMGVSGVEGIFRRSCEKTMAVLRCNQETILTIVEVLLHDPLYDWTITPDKIQKNQPRKRSAGNSSLNSSSSESTHGVNKMAKRALLRLRLKLQGTEEGTATSVEGQVNRLIQQARDPSNLCRMYSGWQPYL